MLGANDGIVSTASLVIGVAAADRRRSAVFIAGFAGLIAGACRWRVGEYVSVSSQRDTEQADLEVEAERSRASRSRAQELAAIYVDRGVDPGHRAHRRGTAHGQDELGAHTVTSSASRRSRRPDRCKPHGHLPRVHDRRDLAAHGRGWRRTRAARRGHHGRRVDRALRSRRTRSESRWCSLAARRRTVCSAAGSPWPSPRSSVSSSAQWCESGGLRFLPHGSETQYHGCRQSIRRSSRGIAAVAARTPAALCMIMSGVTESRRNFAGTPSAIAPLGTSMPFGTSARRANERAGAHDRTVQHDRPRTDERAVLDRAALDVHEVTDHAVVADRRSELAGAVDHAAVLDRRAGADGDAAVVAPQHRLGPDVDSAPITT